MLAGIAWLVFGGPALMAALKEVLRTSFTFGRAEVEDFSPMQPLGEALWKLAPSVGILFAVGVGGVDPEPGGARRAGLQRQVAGAQILADRSRRRA